MMVLGTREQKPGRGKCPNVHTMLLALHIPFK